MAILIHFPENYPVVVETMKDLSSPKGLNAVFSRGLLAYLLCNPMITLMTHGGIFGK